MSPFFVYLFCLSGLFVWCVSFFFFFFERYNVTLQLFHLFLFFFMQLRNLILFIVVWCGVKGISGNERDDEIEFEQKLWAFAMEHFPTEDRVALQTDHKFPSPQWAVVGEKLLDLYEQQYRRQFLNQLSARLPTDEMVSRVVAAMRKRHCPHGVVMCTIVRYGLLSFMESLVHNLIQGVEHVVVYHDDRDNDDNITYTSLLPFIRQGLVTYFSWSKRSQITAYNHCRLRFRNEYKWHAIFDDDEFLVIPSGLCLVNELKKYEEYGGVGLVWAHYCTSKRVRANITSPVTDLFTQRLRFSINIKTIAQVKYIQRWESFHAPRYVKGHHGVDGEKNEIGLFAHENEGLYEKMHLNHYWTRSFEEYVVKTSRGESHAGEKRRPISDFFAHEKHCNVVDESLVGKLPRELVFP
jgi:hypothetical protein